MREMRSEEAIARCRKLVEMHPGEDSFLLGLAWAYHDSGRMEEATGCFERLFVKELAREVLTGFAFDELVRIYKAEKRHDRLVDICERAAAVQPHDPGILAELGDAYLRADRAVDAIVVFRKIIALEPDSSANFCGLGNAYIMAGSYDLAEEAYGRAIAIEPTAAVIFSGRLADEYVRVGNTERAEKVLRNCLACSPDEPLTCLQLADVLIQAGKPDEAVDAYEAVIAAGNQHSAGVYYNRLGNALAFAYCHARAVDAFCKAIAAEPNNPFYHRRLADMYAAMGETAEVAEAMGTTGSPNR